MAWTSLTFPYASLLTSTKMTQLYDNFAALGAGGAPFDIVQAAMGASAIGQAELKTSLGGVNTSTAGANLTLPGGTYGFYPQTKTSGGINPVTAQIASANQSTSYVTNIWLARGGGGGTAFAQQQYVTASGEIYWYFILRDKNTKKILASYAAPDHPCLGNGSPETLPHPFTGYYDPVKHEIVVIQIAREAQADEDSHYPVWFEDMVKGAKTSGRSILEVLSEDYEIDEASQPIPSDKPVTIGFEESPEEVMDLYHRGGKATVRKLIIESPSYIIYKEIKKK